MHKVHHNNLPEPEHVKWSSGDKIFENVKGGESKNAIVGGTMEPAVFHVIYPKTWKVDVQNWSWDSQLVLRRTGLWPYKILKELRAEGPEDAKRSYGARCWLSYGILEDLKARGPEKCLVGLSSLFWVLYYTGGLESWMSKRCLMELWSRLWAFWNTCRLRCWGSRRCWMELWSLKRVERILGDLLEVPWSCMQVAIAIHIVQTDTQPHTKHIKKHLPNSGVFLSHPPPPFN